MHLFREGMLQMSDLELFEKPGDGYWMSFNGFSLHVKLDGDDLVAYGPANIQLRPVNLQRTAWQTAGATNALIHMDYDILSRLAHIYHLQELYEQVTNTALQLLYSGQDVRSPMQDMLSFERELKDKYTEFLEFTSP